MHLSNFYSEVFQTILHSILSKHVILSILSLFVNASSPELSIYRSVRFPETNRFHSAFRWNCFLIDTLINTSNLCAFVRLIFMTFADRWITTTLQLYDVSIFVSRNVFTLGGTTSHGTPCHISSIATRIIYEIRTVDEKEWRCITRFIFLEAAKRVMHASICPGELLERFPWRMPR